MSVDVLVWAERAEPGRRIVYATRPLRVEDAETTPRGLAEAMAASAAGLVFLAQRRVEGAWHYEATRISQRSAKALARVSASVSAPRHRGL